MSLGAALGSACATTTPSLVALDDTRCRNEACVGVRMGAPGQLNVSLRIPRRAFKKDTKWVAFRFAEGVLGRGYTQANVRRWVKGRAVPWPDALEVGPDGVSVDYRVSLHSSEGIDPKRKREISFAYTGGWHLKGYSFLPDLDIPDLQANLRIDPGEAEVALGSAWSDETGFSVANIKDLVRATYEVGHAPHLCARVSGTRLCVTSPTGTSEELAQTMDFIATAMRVTEGLLGPLRQEQVLVSFHRTPCRRKQTCSTEGLAVGGGLVLLSPEPPNTRTFEESGFALTHELLHLWNPGQRRVRPMWLREGLTEYLAYVVASKMTKAGDVPLSAWIGKAYERYRRAVRDRTIAETSDDLVYPAGAVAGFCLDHELRGVGSSTADIVRRLLDRVEPGSNTEISEDWFLSELATVSPRAAGYFKLLISDSRFDFSVCMTRALRHAGLIAENSRTSTRSPPSSSREPR